MQRAKARANSALNEGKAILLGKWEEEVEKGTAVSRGPYIGEELVGMLSQDREHSLYMVKYGSANTKYSMRNLHPNNSQKSFGSAGKWVTEEEARAWMEENKFELEKLDKFLKVRELLEELRN